MSDLAVEDVDEPAAPLPRERERRTVEDADARGIPVRLQGREDWYIQPMPLSPRGLRIAEILDEIEDLNVELAAAHRRVALASAAMEAAEDVGSLDAAQEQASVAVDGRRQKALRLEELYATLGHQALRCLYRVTPVESAALVTQRNFPDIVAALNGRDTDRSQQEAAIAMFERLKRASEKGSDGATPLGQPTGSAGPAASSSPAGSRPTP